MGPIVACVVLVAAIALAFFDRQMLRRMLVIFGATVAQMAVVVAVVWLIYQTRLVGLSALVLAGIGVVDMLVSVLFAVVMEKDAAARQCGDARG